MLRIPRILLVNLSFLLFLFSISNASNVIRVFYCAGERIRYGDTTYFILKNCGEPAYKEILSSEGCDKVEKWHYDCFGRGNVEELIFEKGVLVERISGEKSRGTQSCRPIDAGQ